MNRRGFINLLLKGAAVVPVLPIVALAAPARKLLVQESPIAGFQFYQAERLFSYLREGSPLRLVREPSNKYDKRAVAVYAGERKLGFVPRADNAAVSQMLDRGERLSARIVCLQQSRNPWDRIRFEVAIDG